MSRRRGPLDGTAAATPDERLLDAIYGVEGACEHHLPVRVPATRGVRVRVEGEKILAEVEADGPYENEYLLCGPCATTCIDDHLEPDPPGQEITLVGVRDL